MKNKEEKLSLLSDLIYLVRSDHDVNEREFRFIQAVARNMEVGDEDLLPLFSGSKRPRYVAPETEPERILQFQRLLLLMNIDQRKHKKERVALKDCTLKMGLNPIAVDQVLSAMDSYPDGVVPPNVMINIFKVYYN